MTAPDRPGDRDQQQAAREDAVDAWQAESTVYHYASYTTGYLAARAEEAARWRAKIEALAAEHERDYRESNDPSDIFIATALRSLLDAK